MVTRPRFHITAPSGWLNDPNGVVHHNGVYHAFYQHNPHAAVWGPPHWGHASSPDLVTWRHHAIALAPEPGGPDADGCWSGCVRIIGGVPTLFYTGVVNRDGHRVESVCRATGSADLVDWTRDPGNPIVAGPPPHHGADHRDPFVLRRGDVWWLLLGSSVSVDGYDVGAVLLYESADLSAWTYRAVLFDGRSVSSIDTGQVWECPQLVSLGGRDVLVFSVVDPADAQPLRHAAFVVGKLTGTQLISDSVGLIDHGDALYAPAVTVDAHGRTLMWGWIQERRAAADVNADHAGALSLPRVLDVADGAVTVKLPQEIDALRTTPPRVFRARAGRIAVDVLTEHFEVVARFSGRGQASVELAAADGAPLCRVTLDTPTGTVAVTGSAALAANPPRGVRVGAAGAPIELRLLIDTSIVEVFVNATSFTVRAYGGPPTQLVATCIGDVWSHIAIYELEEPISPRHT